MAIRFLKIERISYNETFSLVVKPTKIRVVLTLDLSKGVKNKTFKCE